MDNREEFISCVLHLQECQWQMQEGGKAHTGDLDVMIEGIQSATEGEGQWTQYANHSDQQSG